MADATELLALLDEQIDDLAANLAPLLDTSIRESATNLPVVDKARLYVLAAYSVESLLFTYLRLNGINTKEHPIMRELARIRGYVGKINDAEATTKREGLSLDKEAAGRFIKHALAGNEKYDADRAKTQARERANAQKKFEELQRAAAARGADGKEEVENEGENEGESGEEEEEVEVLEIIDGEKEAREARNKEQVDRILMKFRSHLAEKSVERMTTEENERKGMTEEKKEITEEKNEMAEDMEKAEEMEKAEKMEEKEKAEEEEKAEKKERKKERKKEKRRREKEEDEGGKKKKSKKEKKERREKAEKGDKSSKKEKKEKKLKT